MSRVVDEIEQDAHPRAGSAVRHMLRSFSVQDDCLQIGGFSLTRLAQRVGQTPFFAYSRDLVSRRVAELRQAMPATMKLHYAIKANPFRPLVHHLQPLVDGFDVASGAELAIALDTGIAPHDISFAGPGKRDDELLRALAAGILLNVESTTELDRIGRLARCHGLTSRVALRINPDYALRSSGMSMGGSAKQFGIDATAIPGVLRALGEQREWLRFEGFQIFSGAQNLNAGHLIDAQRRALNLVIELAPHTPSPIRCFNLGGGFGVPYFDGDMPLDIEAVGSALHALCADAARALPDAEIVLELGRYLVSEAGIYVCSVVDRKVSNGVPFLVMDGGMHHHLSASGNLGQLIRRNYPVVVGNRVVGDERERVNVVGPLCTPLDIIAHQATLATARPGDLLVVFQSGAYGLTASPNGFLSQPAAREVIV